MGLFGMGGSNHNSGFIEGCYTMHEIPGKNISRALGLIEYTQKGIAGDMPKLCEEIFEGLLASAKKKGANAVVNVRVMAGSYQERDSQWEVTYVVAYGDAVIVD